MYLVLTDETNREDANSEFFLMGGVAIPFENASNLHAGIQRIRNEYGYNVGDSLKYARASKPEQVSNEQFNNAKSEVIDLCNEFGVKIFLYVCHHLIAENKTPIKKFQWGSNGLLWNVNRFLREIGSTSWVLQDRHPVEGEFAYYRQRFSESQPAYQGHYHKLDRIIGFGSTCDGASHLASIADICLGSYRFCINNPDKNIVNGILMPKLLENTWGYPNCIGNGIGLYPTGVVNKRECKPHYERLRSQIAEYTDA